LGYFTLRLLNIDINFLNSILVLRFYSAVFSLLSIYFFYLISKNKIATLLFIFTPGLIQLAHFGTTESLLIFVFLVNIYLSSQNPSFKIYLLASIITGVGLATKVSAIFFIAPFLFVKPNKYHLLFLVSGFLFLLLSPYNLIAKDDFLSSMRYETQVATGALKVFYTTQFEKTIPYLFQFTHIFPYISGLPVFILFFFGLIHKSYIVNRKSIIIFLSCFIYFLYFGQLYVKWTRFMSPLFFLFPLLAGYFLSNLKNKYLKLFLLIICLIPGIVFFSQYFRSDIRVVASAWVDENIPKNSITLSESGNVVNLPPANVFYDFYSNPFPPNLANYDYVIIPSRRVFKNNIAPAYYQDLFSGKSGFKLLKQFSPPSELFLNPENAEETWSVFDHPTVRLFSK